jgi:hypothetical protein
MRERLARMVLAIAVVLSMGAMSACDREDRRDLEEGVNEVEKGAEDIEEGVDEEVDTDGKDD